MGRPSEGQGQEGGACKVPQGAVERGRAGWAHGGRAPGWRTPALGELGAVLGGRSGWLDRARGAWPAGSRQTVSRGADLPSERVQEGPRESPPTLAQQWGAWGRQRAKSGWEEVETVLPHALGLPTLDRLRASLPAHSGPRGPRGSPPPQLTPVIGSPLSSDCCCHFPRLGRTRDSFKNISFAK